VIEYVTAFEKLLLVPVATEVIGFITISVVSPVFLIVEIVPEKLFSGAVTFDTNTLFPIENLLS
jgi:hypothetical protein